MHELSIALRILDRTAEEVQKQGGGNVTVVHTRIGQLSGVVREALEFAFEIARADSPFPEARLVIEEVPVVIYCEPCAAEQEIETMPRLCCPVCGTFSGRVIRGKELEITALEIESPVSLMSPTVSPQEICREQPDSTC